MKTNLLTRLIAGALLVPFMYGCSPSDSTENDPVKNWEKTPTGVVINLTRDPVKKLRLNVIDDHILRVTATPGSDFGNLPDTYMVVKRAEGAEFDLEQRDGQLLLRTEKLTAEVALQSGEVTFKDARGQVRLVEAGRGSFKPVTRDPGRVDNDSYAIRQQFESTEDEAFYGLGQQQGGKVNYAGHNLELTTGNMEITIPYLISSRNYGLLWNQTSVSRLGDPEPAKPLNEGLTLYDAGGQAGGFTVRYYDGQELLLERVEADTNYQFLARGSEREVPMPEVAREADNLRIEMEGAIESDVSGKHQLRMYSSGYAKLSINGEKKLDRWRMNWNPWYHDHQLTMDAGKKYRLNVDWIPQGGYLRLKHHKPLPAEEQNRLSLASDTAKAIDYYFVMGENADDLIAGYRDITGEAVMLPKWAFGFWQSRERYKTAQELLTALEEYRKRRIPIDNIVLDWNYWPEDAWGSHKFDKERFADPSAMVDRVHELNANIMISVWPKYYPTTNNYKALNAAGCMFNKNIEEKNLDWIGPGYLNAFYDAFNPECRNIFWTQIRDQIKKHGFDAWWLDAVEPDIHSNLSFEHRKDLMTPNADGTGAEVFNAYALPHAEAVYKGERQDQGNQRSFILTRSGFGGIQRTGSAIWTGDIVSRWSNLEEQIAAGIGAGLAGMPYWTFDIGGFTPEDRYRYSDQGVVGHYSMMNEEEIDEWQEINTRWFQFGAFAPLFRSHGQNPYREIYNIADEGSRIYDTLVWYTKLRYRLMPYIYTLAGDAYHLDSTLMRGLIMDFPEDPEVRDIHDQYMFGPALLVSPVTEYKARSREVYLPAGTDWYDFYTGQKFTGGQHLSADAPLTRMPLFVKSGSILPTGANIQYVYDEPDAPYTLNVYTGANASFDIYEDDGKTYAYEQGEFSRIPVDYDQTTGTLTLGERRGEFDGMIRQREIRVRWIDGKREDAADFDTGIAQTVTYHGGQLVLRRP